MKRDLNYNVQNVICYLRRSRQDIERERKTGENTLSTQKKIMTKVLDEIERPYDITEEIGSGDKIETRPVFKQVLQWLRQNKYNAIAVKEIARLGRGSYSDMGEIFDLIKEKRIFIITPYKIYDIENSADARQIRFELFFAREEFEMIRERMLSSKLNLAHEGRWVVGATPFGYKLNPATTMLVINEEEAEIVSMIFDWYVFGIEQPDGSIKNISFRAIAGHLNRIGIQSPRNGMSGWAYLTVKRILENVAYIGTFEYRKRKRIGNKYYDRPQEEWIVVEEAHPSIISKDIWEQAKDKRENRRRTSTKIDFSPCELAGLVICTKCGKRMVRQYSVQHYQKKDGTESIYKKEFLWCTTNGCTFVKYRDVEEDIIHILKDMNELDIEQIKSLYDNVNPHEEIKAPTDLGKMIEKRKKELALRLEFAREKHSSGVWDDDDFIFEKAKIKKELAELENLSPSPELNNSRKEQAAVELKVKIKNLLTIYNKVTNKTSKNELLSQVVDKIYLTKTGKGIYDLDVHPIIAVK